MKSNFLLPNWLHNIPKSKDSEPTFRLFFPITAETKRKAMGINESPLVLVAQPRSGTHWLKGMLESLPGFRPAPSQRFELNPEALYSSIKSEPPGTVIVDHLFFTVCAHVLYECSIQPLLLIRDLRDVLVSQMFYLFKDTDLDVHSLSIWKPLLKAFVNGEAYDLPDRGLHTFRPARWRFLNQSVFWLDFPGVFVVKYEDLVANTTHEMSRIVSHLNLQLGADQLNDIVAKFNFTALSQGRNKGEENPKHHYRKGFPGDWRDKLDEEDIALIEEAIGDLNARLGYSTYT